MMVIGVALTTATRPTTSGARLKRRCQNASLSTITGWPPLTASSAGVSTRPIAAVAPSTSNVLPETISATTRSLASPIRKDTLAGARATSALKPVVPSWRSRNIGWENARSSVVRPRNEPGPSSCTSSPGARTSSARSTTRSSRLKMAVLAPMPRARVRMTISANPGERLSVRMA